MTEERGRLKEVERFVVVRANDGVSDVEWFTRIGQIEGVTPVWFDSMTTLWGLVDCPSQVADSIASDPYLAIRRADEKKFPSEDEIDRMLQELD